MTFLEEYSPLTLFMRPEDASPIRFAMSDGPEFLRIKSAIESGGGVLENSRKTDVTSQRIRIHDKKILLLESEVDVFDYKYIDDCVKDNVLHTNLSGYRLGPSLFSDYDPYDILIGESLWTSLKRLKIFAGEECSQLEDFDDYARGSRKMNRPYTLSDQVSILKYIIENNKFRSLRETKLWKDMEADKVCGGTRTYAAMKDHFKRQILPRIHVKTFPQFEEEDLDLIVECWKGTKEVSPIRNSDVVIIQKGRDKNENKLFPSDDQADEEGLNGISKSFPARNSRINGKEDIYQQLKEALPQSSSVGSSTSKCNTLPPAVSSSLSRNATDQTASSKKLTSLQKSPQKRFVNSSESERPSPKILLTDSHTNKEVALPDEDLFEMGIRARGTTFFTSTQKSQNSPKQVFPLPYKGKRLNKINKSNIRREDCFNDDESTDCSDNDFESNRKVPVIITQVQGTYPASTRFNREHSVVYVKKCINCCNSTIKSSHIPHANINSAHHKKSVIKNMKKSCDLKGRHSKGQRCVDGEVVMLTRPDEPSSITLAAGANVAATSREITENHQNCRLKSLSGVRFGLNNQSFRNMNPVGDEILGNERSDSPSFISQSTPDKSIDNFVIPRKKSLHKLESKDGSVPVILENCKRLTSSRLFTHNRLQKSSTRKLMRSKKKNANIDPLVAYDNRVKDTNYPGKHSIRECSVRIKPLSSLDILCYADGNSFKPFNFELTQTIDITTEKPIESALSPSKARRTKNSASRLLNSFPQKSLLVLLNRLSPKDIPSNIILSLEAQNLLNPPLDTSSNYMIVCESPQSLSQQTPDEIRLPDCENDFGNSPRSIFIPESSSRKILSKREDTILTEKLSRHDSDLNLHLSVSQLESQKTPGKDLAENYDNETQGISPKWSGISKFGKVNNPFFTTKRCTQKRRLYNINNQPIPQAFTPPSNDTQEFARGITDDLTSTRGRDASNFCNNRSTYIDESYDNVSPQELRKDNVTLDSSQNEYHFSKRPVVLRLRNYQTRLNKKSNVNFLKKGPKKRKRSNHQSDGTKERVAVDKKDNETLDGDIIIPKKKRKRGSSDMEGKSLIFSWEQDKLIREFFRDFKRSPNSGDFIKLSKHSDFRNCSPKMIKNRYFSIIKSKVFLHRYSNHEDEIILQWLTSKNHLNNLSSDYVWIKMAKDKVIPGRTYFSLKERFWKKILPNIKNYNLKKTVLESIINNTK